MKIPVDKLTRAFKMGASVKKDSDTPVRVSVYLDSSASRFLAETVRDAFVPQTTSGIVRVERLGEERIAPKTDTDVVLVLSCGSDRLESAVQELVIAGAPVCVLAESAVEVPFIEESTPVLGVVAATDKTYLLETLARWILDRTEKETAFAANFAFMRIAAANRIITSCALTNMATGALVFLPGADYPVMALAQVGMLFELAAVFGRGIKPERGYEVAGVLAGGLVIRAVTRALAAYWVCRQGAHCCCGHLWHGPCARFALRARCRLQPCQRGGHCHVLPRSRSGDHGRGRYPSYGVLSRHIRSRCLGVFRCAFRIKTVFI